MKNRERELREELASHLAMAAADGGRPREFGNDLQVTEATRAQWPRRWAGDLARDLDYAARGLRRSPVFALAAVAAFALALGATAAIYAMADGIYFHPLPQVPREQQMLALERSSSGSLALAPAEFQRLQDAVQAGHSALASLGAYAGTQVVWNGKTPRELTGARISGGFFPMLGVAPRLGRILTPADAATRVAVLGYGLWQQAFGGDMGIVGRQVSLDHAAYTVVGVMPRDFYAPSGSDIWLPLAYSPLDWSTEWAAAGKVRANHLHAWARLRPGATLKQARAELRSFSASQPDEAPGKHPQIYALALNDQLNGTLTPVFMDALLGAMAFLLLLACANVANLNLARATARAPELATRRALGASRGRIARQLLAEAVLLGLLGGAAGLGVAYAGLKALGAAFPATIATQIAGFASIRLSPAVLGFTFLLCLGAGMLSGLAPAWRASALRPRDSQRLRHGLLAAQTALALVLLTGTALMFTGMQHYLRGTRQFEGEGMMTAALSLPKASYGSPAQRADFDARLLQALKTTPGVRSASLFSAAPFSNNGVTWVRYQRSDAPSAPALGAIEQVVSPGYFAAMRIPLLQGRDFTQSDSGAGAAGVAIIGKHLAESVWPGQSPLGREIRTQAGGPWLRVIGVAGDVEYDWTDNAAEPAIYRPVSQAAAADTLIGARGNLAQMQMAAALRGALAQVDPDLPLTQVQTLAATMYDGLSAVYVMGWLIAVLGVMALGLALAGLLGVAAYNATRRQREIGIRIACGARPGAVVRLMLRQNLILVGVGTAVGAVAAFAFTRLAAGIFFGVHAEDNIWALPLAAVLLLLAALLACWVPARRAALADPTAVLRQE